MKITIEVNYFFYSLFNISCVCLFALHCYAKRFYFFLTYPFHRYLFIAIPRSSDKTPSMFASSSIVIDVHVGLIVRAFNFEAPRQRETLSSILRRDPRPRSPFTLSSPFHIYLGLLHYGHFGRSFFRLLFHRVSFG